MPNQESILQAQNVRFRYDPEQPTYAVDGVSVDIRRGEFVAVLGANGCGKSTLAKHFNAILLPETGTVLVEGMDTRNEDHLYDVRQKVGMVFQNPDNQIVATIVEEDVAFAPENLGVPPEEIRARIDEAMKLAQKICTNAQKAIRASKLAIRRGIDCDISTAVSYEALAFATCFGTEDQKEGMQAFLEKRKEKHFKNK